VRVGVRVGVRVAVALGVGGKVGVRVAVGEGDEVAVGVATGAGVRVAVGGGADREIGGDLDDLGVEFETLRRNLGKAAGETSEDVRVDVGRRNPHPRRDFPRIGVIVDDDDHVVAQVRRIDGPHAPGPSRRDRSDQRQEQKNDQPECDGRANETPPRRG
jgi:hypothetical protein